MVVLVPPSTPPIKLYQSRMRQAAKGEGERLGAIERVCHKGCQGQYTPATTDRKGDSTRLKLCLGQSSFTSQPTH